MGSHILAIPISSPRAAAIMLSRAARPAFRAGAAVTLRPAVASAPVVQQSSNYATLREIEGRLKSIRNIEKITKTMKIVASTKLTRAQRAMNESRTYGQTSNTVYDEAETKAMEGENQKKLLVVCSSDKGLCGGIHSGLTRAVRRLMNEEPADYDLVILGEKCKAQLSRGNAKQISLTFTNIGKDIPTFADAQAIADQISLLSQDYSETKIMYNKFVNAQAYEPTVILAYSEEVVTQSPNFSSFEVDQEVLANLQEYSLANSLFWALAEGHACKNAGDMIDRYQILFNRTRQAVITGELVEIIT